MVQKKFGTKGAGCDRTETLTICVCTSKDLVKTVEYLLFLLAHFTPNLLMLMRCICVQSREQMIEITF